MSNSVYGVVSHSGNYTDVSKTLHGAKCYATRHGYRIVARRNTNHYYVDVMATKQGKHWVAE